MKLTMSDCERLAVETGKRAAAFHMLRPTLLEELSSKGVPHRKSVVQHLMAVAANSFYVSTGRLGVKEWHVR